MNSDKVTPLDKQRLQQVKAAYTTRHVARAAMASLITNGAVPNSGDVVLARIDRIGKHKQLEFCDGRRSTLFIGDEILICYGNRYAPDQYEALVPKNLAPCHLVAGGGVAAQALSWHEAIPGPTCITPLGLVADAEGIPLNLKNWSLARQTYPQTRPFTIVVVGAAMNAGKTITAAHLIKGAARAKIKVAAAKVTGTGSGGDTWLMRDAGADSVLDFTDCGFVSTYLATKADVESIMQTLVVHLASSGAETIVLEIADGLYQEETAALLSSQLFAQNVDAVMFAANDALGAAAGVEWLRERNLPIVGITGTLAQSPLAMREAASATALRVYHLSQLSDPAFALNQLVPSRRAA